MRSASSSTSTCTCERFTWLCSMRSMRRPGVATSRSHPLSSALIWRSNLAPPMTTTVDWPVWAQTSFVTSSIWLASSRVGVMTRARGFLDLASLPASAMRCSVGSVKAQVLPVPVWALARTSLPSSTAGMARACTGVGSVKPRESTPASICSLSPSSANEVVIAASMPHTLGFHNVGAACGVRQAYACRARSRSPRLRASWKMCRNTALPCRPSCSNSFVTQAWLWPILLRVSSERSRST